MEGPGHRVRQATIASRVSTRVSESGSTVGGEEKVVNGFRQDDDEYGRGSPSSSFWLGLGDSVLGWVSRRRSSYRTRGQVETNRTKGCHKMRMRCGEAHGQVDVGFFLVPPRKKVKWFQLIKVKDVKEEQAAAISVHL